MEAPLIAIIEAPAAQPAPAAPAARKTFTPARVLGAVLAVAAVAAVALSPFAGTFRRSAAPADQDDEENHPASDPLAPVTYRSMAEVAAAVPGAVVSGANPLVLCVQARSWDTRARSWPLAGATFLPAHPSPPPTIPPIHTNSIAAWAWVTGGAAAAPPTTP